MTSITEVRAKILEKEKKILHLENEEALCSQCLADAGDDLEKATEDLAEAQDELEVLWETLHGLEEYRKNEEAGE